MKLNKLKYQFNDFSKACLQEKVKDRLFFMEEYGLKLSFRQAFENNVKSAYVSVWSNMRGLVRGFDEYGK